MLELLFALLAVAACGFAGGQWGQGYLPLGKLNKIGSPLIAGAGFLPLSLTVPGLWWLSPAAAAAFYLYRFPGPGLGFPKRMDDIPAGRMNWRAWLTRLVIRDWRKPLEADWTETRAGSILYHALRSVFAAALLVTLAAAPVTGDALTAWPVALLALRGLAYWFVDGRARSWNFEAHFAEITDGALLGVAVAAMTI